MRKLMIMKKQQSIEIDPRFNMFYSSYYIQGLKSVFGKFNLHYSWSEFKEVNYGNRHPNERYLIFKAFGKNLVIDFSDGNCIDHSFYKWSDVYAKVNSNPLFLTLPTF